MKITELKGKAQVFTLKDGSTLRIFANQTKEIAKKSISENLKIAEEMGLILITENDVKEEVSKTKKGGTK